MKKDIYTFIDIICNNLKIKKPRIQIKHGTFVSGTVLAAYNYKNKKIVINDPKSYENKADLLLAIAHELRHKYQIDHDMFDFENYKTSKGLTIEEYNLKKEEIDANAYACVVMMDLFGIKPLFNGLSTKVVREIEKKVDEIVSEC